MIKIFFKFQFSNLTMSTYVTVLHGEYVVLHDCDKDIYVVYHHGNCFTAAIIKNTIIIFVAAKRWRNLPN